VCLQYPPAFCSTPLKLTGWELWLCGEADGPLFDPPSVTAEDGAAEVDVDVVRKSVAARPADVASVQESLATKAARLQQESVSTSVGLSPGLSPYGLPPWCYRCIHTRMLL
jgi:hypothetical protein